MYRARYVNPDPRLGRHVNHDPRSRRYAVPRAAGVDLVSIRHERHAPVFDQGSLGSCTGNAGIGCLATGPFFGTLSSTEKTAWPLDQAGALKLYSSATRLDDFPGEYPPEDTGSDGLSIAKVLKSAGLISGYTHAFSISALTAGLMSTPCIVGTEWTEAMFEPDADGVVYPNGSAQGGHEYVCDEFIDVGKPFGPGGRTANTMMFGFTNSWGEGWGVDGRFYMGIDYFDMLLKRQGDATFFVPSTEPAPDPAPVVPGEPEVDSADVALAAAVSRWARKVHPSDCLKARRAVRTWLETKGL